MLEQIAKATKMPSYIEGESWGDKLHDKPDYLLTRAAKRQIEDRM